MKRENITLSFLSLIALTYAFTTNAIEERIFNPTEIPQVSFKGQYIPFQTFSPTNKPSVKLDFSNAWSGGIEMEMPIIKYLHSGLILQAIVLPSAVKFRNQNDGNILNPRERYTSFILDFDLELRPQIPFVIGKGGLALYALGTFGLSVNFIDPFTAMTEKSGDTYGIGDAFINPVGTGFNVGGAAGISYFPIPEIGFFVEGGYRYTHLFFKTILSGNRPEQKLSLTGSGPMLAFGVKLAT